MHKIQQQILFFADQVNLKRDGLRQIGRLIGEPHPFKVSYHLKHLEENGFIKIDEKTGAIRCLKKETSRQGLFSAIPVIGRANCGVASVYAEQSLEGYIKISKKIFPITEGFIAIQASGNSMNKANVSGNNIEDGDYVIVDTKKTAKANDYVLAVIDDCANIKRFIPSKKDHSIYLMSESSEKHPLIVLHESDKFLINGVVMYVIKKPKVFWP